MEGLYYPYSENKGADQLRGYREADLCLCFRICKKPVFSRRGSNGKRTERAIILKLGMYHKRPKHIQIQCTLGDLDLFTTRSN